MSEPLPVTFTALAAKHIRTADAWWRENRTLAPDAVRQELERALVLIAGQPRIGSRATHVKMPGVRRIFLPIIKQYLYDHMVERLQCPRNPVNDACPSTCPLMMKRNFRHVIGVPASSMDGKSSAYTVNRYLCGGPSGGHGPP